MRKSTYKQQQVVVNDGSRLEWVTPWQVEKHVGDSSRKDGHIAQRHGLQAGTQHEHSGQVLWSHTNWLAAAEGASPD